MITFLKETRPAKLVKYNSAHFYFHVIILLFSWEFSEGVRSLSSFWVGIWHVKISQREGIILLNLCFSWQKTGQDIDMILVLQIKVEKHLHVINASGNKQFTNQTSENGFKSTNYSKFWVLFMWSNVCRYEKIVFSWKGS